MSCPFRFAFRHSFQFAQFVRTALDTSPRGFSDCQHPLHSPFVAVCMDGWYAPIAASRSLDVHPVASSHSFQRGSGSTLSNLAFAALVLLIASPLSLFDVGFQLSFTAVLGIVLFNTYVWQRYPLPVWSDFDPVYGNIRHARRHGLSPHRVWRFYLIQHSYGFFRQVVYPFFTVSFSAQLGTLPFILYYFHQFSPYALFANVIVIPSAYLLLGGSLLFFLLPFDILRQGLSVLLHGVLQGMTAVLDSISHCARCHADALSPSTQFISISCHTLRALCHFSSAPAPSP